jgi:hypothetical protein
MNAPEVAWMPLKAKYGLANSHEDIAANIESVLKTEYTGFQEIMDTKSGAVSVVGSGPSLKKNWKKLKNLKADIIACNASCQFLLERGIIPQYMFCFDADKLVMAFFEKPHKDVTYIISSRCVPQVFEALKGFKVIVVHALGDIHLESLLQKYGKHEPMVIGGSAAVTRGMLIAASMGYMTIHLWGVDGSFSEGDTHIGPSTTVEVRTKIMMNKRVFEMAPWMTRQVDDFKLLAPPLKNMGKRIIVHGDGIIPYLAETMGFETDGVNSLQRSFRKVKLRAGLLWKYIQ